MPSKGLIASTITLAVFTTLGIVATCALIAAAMSTDVLDPVITLYQALLVAVVTGFLYYFTDRAQEQLRLEFQLCGNGCRRGL